MGSGRVNALELALREHPDVADVHVEPALSSASSDHLVAMIVPAQAGPITGEREHVQRWRDVYDSLYAGSATTGATVFNTAGWRRRSDRQPIPEQDMRGWMCDTVERILADTPSDVLEVGCGTGLLLFPTAPSCRRYLATDVSATAIDLLDSVIARQRSAGRWSANVELACSPAHEVAQAAAGSSFDTAIINSVVQHFPGVGYFERTLAALLGVIRRPGRIYIGDVRNLRLLTTFHLAAALARAQPDVTLDELRERVRRATAAETELLLSPEYFLALPQRFPAIRHVEVQLKRGRYLDELRLFRYEVILHLGDVETIPPELQLCWSPAFDGATLQHLLERQRPRTLQLCAVPNRSLAAHCLRVDVLHGGLLDRAEQLTSIGLESAASGPGLEPSAVIHSARLLGYNAEIHCSADGNPRRFDAVLRDSSRRGPLPALPATTPPPLTKASVSQTQSPATLESYLGRRFPSQELPSCVVIGPRLCG